LVAAYDPLRRQDPGIESRAFSAHPSPESAPTSMPSPSKNPPSHENKTENQLPQLLVLTKTVTPSRIIII